MADSALNIIGRWAAAALCAAAASIAHAQPPHGYRAQFAAPNAHAFWGAPHRSAAPLAPHRVPRGNEPRSFVMATDAYGHGGAHIVPAPALAPSTVPFRPVSDEARTLAREGGNAYMRAGSIRADIARYNEEREATHVPRPPNANGDEPRGARQPSVYRN
ncbi:peptide-binding protein [Trinickia sp.]|uniref:peptide-binding protein n=1 Tax=Trinickia sp. TaxID=2571163 RepID=UPI003F812A81